MRNYFTFDGEDSRDYGVYISGQGTFNAPARDYDLISVPGRNGQIIGNERRFQNIKVTYPAYIYTDFDNKLAELRALLLSPFGYVRIEDSYHPGEYRLGFFEGEFSVSPTNKNDAGQFNITFNCKPQRFLKAGETSTTLTASGTLTNPTLFASLPLIRIYGTGQVNIGTQAINTYGNASGYIDIDCELMDCYQGATSKNSSVAFSGSLNGRFPVFEPGDNAITLGSGITQVDITPRWWTL